MTIEYILTEPKFNFNDFADIIEEAIMLTGIPVEKFYCNVGDRGEHIGRVECEEAYNMVLLRAIARTSQKNGLTEDSVYINYLKNKPSQQVHFI